MALNPSKKANVQATLCPQSNYYAGVWTASFLKLHCAQRLHRSPTALCLKIACVRELHYYMCPKLHYALKMHCAWDCIVSKNRMCKRIALLHVPETVLCPKVALSSRLHWVGRLHVPKNYIITLCSKIACARRLNYRMCPKLHCARKLHVPNIALRSRIACAPIHLYRVTIDSDRKMLE